MQLTDNNLIYYAEMFANKLSPYSTKDTIDWMNFCKVVNPDKEQPWY